MYFEMQGTKNQSNMADISLYVEHHLADLLPTKYRQKLVDRSNGHFIWVSTARSELELAADDPTRFKSTLDFMLTRTAGGDLDALYLSIMNRLLRSQSRGSICEILATLAALYEPVSIAALGALTNVEEEDLELTVKTMRSVLRVEATIEFLHPTFRDYLTGSQIQGKIPDLEASHTGLALKTLEILQRDLKVDICHVDLSGFPFSNNAGIPGLDTKLSMLSQRSPALLYSSTQWIHHVSQVIKSDSVINQLSNFLETKLLNLIELLSLTGRVLLLRYLADLRIKLEIFHPGRQEIELCSDTLRLVQSQQTIIEQSALHVYSSALLFLPTETKICKLYKRQFERNLPEVACGIDAHWPSYQVLSGHSGTVRCLALSPDGTRIVTGSQDKSLRLWDAIAGASMGPAWKGPTGTIVCVSFSPDGTKVAYGSRDSKVWLWDVEPSMGKGISLKGHTDVVTCLAFSPNGKSVVSGSGDNTLRLWDAMTGVGVGSGWKGHEDAVLCLAFSPDGTRVISGSMDKTLRIWDPLTGATIGSTLTGHSAPVTCMEFFTEW